MYEFVDTNQGQEVNNRLPSEALIINGTTIEDEIQGYKTLTVSGRELLAPEINSVRRTNGDGSLFLGKTYPPRTITVQYQLKANDNMDFREKFEQLNRILSVEQAELKFQDDLDHTFHGTLSDVSELPEGTNTVIGTFSFYCSDPFKYTAIQSVKGEDRITLYYDGTYETRPSKIIVTPNKTENEISIRIHDARVSVKGGSFSGEIVFDFEEQEIWMGGTSLLDKLTLSSNFEDFYIASRFPITFEQGGTIEASVRQVKL